MNRKIFLTVLLLASLLLLNACNKQTNDPQTGDSDTATSTQEIIETEPDIPAAPEIPVVGDPQTEPLPEETTVIPEETEPVPEITEPLPELPTDLPGEETTADLEPTEPQEPVTPAPVVIVKPTVDITDQLIPGGDAVTGQIASAQSETLRLLLDYSVKQSEDGTAELTLNVGLSCYELWCSAKTDMGTITVNGVSRTFSTDAIDHMERSQAYIPFLTQTYNATGNQSASIEVSWNYNGVYGGTEIGTLSTGLILVYGTDGTSAPMPIEPSESEPAVTEPVIPEPAVTEPVQPDPLEPEPVVTEPVEPEPIVTEPIQPEPAEPDPVETAPAENEPAVTEPTEPVTPTEPAEGETTQTPDAPLPEDAGNPQDTDNPDEIGNSEQ